MRSEEPHEFVVFEVGDNGFGVTLGPLLEGVYTVGIRAGEFGFDCFHVCLHRISSQTAR